MFSLQTLSRYRFLVESLRIDTDNTCPDFYARRQELLEDHRDFYASTDSSTREEATPHFGVRAPGSDANEVDPKAQQSFEHYTLYQFVQQCRWCDKYFSMHLNQVSDTDIAVRDGHLLDPILHCYLGRRGSDIRIRSNSKFPFRTTWTRPAIIQHAIWELRREFEKKFPRSKKFSLAPQEPLIEFEEGDLQTLDTCTSLRTGEYFADHLKLAKKWFAERVDLYWRMPAHQATAFGRGDVVGVDWQKVAQQWSEQYAPIPMPSQEPRRGWYFLDDEIAAIARYLLEVGDNIGNLDAFEHRAQVARMAVFQNHFAMILIAYHLRPERIKMLHQRRPNIMPKSCIEIAERHYALLRDNMPEWMDAVLQLKLDRPDGILDADRGDDGNDRAWHDGRNASRRPNNLFDLNLGYCLDKRMGEATYTKFGIVPESSIPLRESNSDWLR